MKKEYTEKELLRVIKLVPIIMVTIFSIIITYVVVNNNIIKHDISIKSFKTNFIKEKKSLIKNETEKIIRQINYQKNLAEENLRIRLKKRVDNASNIINNIYLQNKNDTKNKILKMVKDAIRPIRYDNNRGYFFIYNMKGINILLPTAPRFEGKNMLELQDKKGFFMIKESIKIAKKDKEGFIQWYWYKPNDNTTMHKKLGYIKYIKELDLFIGIGEYFEDFENEIKNNLLKEISINSNNNKNYFFIENNDNNFLTEAVDEKNNKFYKKEIKELNGSNHFIEYVTNNNLTKLSYINYIADWNWYIGSGIYLDEIKMLIENNIKEFDSTLEETMYIIIISSVVLTFILIFMLWKLSKTIEYKFLRYKKQINLQLKENKEKDKLIFEQSKMVSMGEMIGNIAHQWRQPLSVILTASSSIQLKLLIKDFDNNSIDKICKVINKNTMYLSNTIDDFSNFITGNREKKNFYLKHTLETMSNLIESSFSANDIKLIIKTDDKMQIYGYENELLQCFINICNNAKDVLLEQNIENKIIIIDYYMKNKYLIITIKDNANGIHKDILSKIFEPYFTTKHKSLGTGIGLHMTYDLIVNGMNGTIEANNITYEHDNNTYTGAIFKISLPII